MVSALYHETRHIEATVHVDEATDLSALWRRICWYGGAHLEGCEDNKYLIKAVGDGEEVMRVVNACIDMGNSGKVFLSFS